LTEIPECPYCHKKDFASRGSRDVHVYRERKKSESVSASDKLDRIFERFGKPKYEKLVDQMSGRGEEPKSTPREAPKTKSNLRDFWREEMERKIEEFKEGKFKDEEDCASEYLTILQTEGMEKNIAFKFYDHLKKRLYALNQTQSVAPQPNSQPQSQPLREPTLDEMAELEAQKINAQRGFAIAPRYACEICHRDGLSYEEAVACEQSHQTVITTQNESETPREISRPIVSSQSLPQSDAVIRGIKSLLSKFAKSPKQKEEKTEVQETESYSPITYHNIVTWTPPEPIPTRVCEVCGETVEIGALLAGHHGKGRCG
jgi:hypothetical protein